MFWSMMFTVVFLSSSYTVDGFSDFNISGCAVNITWSLTNASGYEISIKAETDSSFPIQIVTRSTVFSFTFVAERPGLNYTVRWTPIYDRNGSRDRNVKFREEHTFHIHRATASPSTASPSTASPSTTKSFFEQDSDFCFIYFWTSVVSFPLVLVGCLLLLYVWLIKKQPGTNSENHMDQGTMRLNVSMDSPCYANNKQNVDDDEFHYSLAE